MSRFFGNCTHCFKPWHDGMTCDFAAGHREAYAEITAKMRTRATVIEKESKKCEHGSRAWHDMVFQFEQMREEAEWIEAGCP